MYHRIPGLKKSFLWYVYPIRHRVSFTIIAKEHVKQLRKYYTVYEIEEKAFLSIVPYSQPNVCVHPYLYALLSEFDVYSRLKARYSTVFGFEVADSDRISPIAINAVNQADVLIVPSEWSRQAYLRSGTKIPVHVVPHGLRKEFYRKKRLPVHPTLQELFLMKMKRNPVLIFFFIWHSSFRKGLDLVYKIMKRLQKERDNVVLVLNAVYPGDKLVSELAKLKTVLLVGWYNLPDFVDLMDICDIYLLTSRGGGFEMLGLEALARGEIVVAPDKGPWTEYLPKESLVKTARFVTVLPNNPIHIGKGPEIDVEKAVDKLCEIIDNLSEWKEKYAKYSIYIRKNYSWDAIGIKLNQVISKYYK